ncbi:MAG: reactive intermediate/imine deaminase [Sulfobacillus acidophilus]|uniref:Reactive intermediate/imine deaminase n=1 Tax=Sulfobacillus acidophilus TaxID=53633 RepID=A0A2T2WK10_9FIRM|nr:MAG: reactive intermediate/imine deaminase [Sulfobacillus acidophilus]
MSKQEIRTENAPQPGGAYSQGLRASGTLVYTAGVGPMDPQTQTIVGTTIEEQTRQVLRNLAAILEEAGLTMDHVVKTSVFLQDLQRDFAAFNRVYQEFFSPPFPVRTTVGATLNNILVEIDCVAVAD